MKMRRNIKFKCLEIYFAQKRREIYTDSQIKIRYYYMRYKVRRYKERLALEEEARLKRLEEERLIKQQIELFRLEECERL